MISSSRLSSFFEDAIVREDSGYKIGRVKSIVNASVKQSRFSYYLENLATLSQPSRMYGRRIRNAASRLTGTDAASVEARSNYYNRLTAFFDPGESAMPFRFNLFGGRRNYAMDLHRYLRCFDSSLRLNWKFGDISNLPGQPTILKARPIQPDNENGVLMNLNKIRHFVFVDDHMPFEQKKNIAVWRGNAFQPWRKEFLSRYCNHPRCDVGHAHKRKKDGTWDKPFLGIRDQLKYKFILSIEGNDVATNLKWIMSSNSLCLMRRPRMETWFMEGLLQPGVHYVQLKDDFSDLEEKMDFYLANPAEALAIIRQANAYVEQFSRPEIEDAIALRVLEKYFVLSGQLAPGG